METTLKTKEIEEILNNFEIEELEDRMEFMTWSCGCTASSNGTVQCGCSAGS